MLSRHHTLARTVSLITLFVLAIGLVPAVARAQPAGTTVYQDPAGRFSVPVPTNWTAAAAGDVVTLTDPEGAIIVYALAVEAPDAAQGIATAWTRVRPGFSLEAAETNRPPAEPGVEETVQIDYDAGPERIVSATGRLVEGVVYALLADGPLEAVARRGAQLEVIFSGFRITDLQRESLAGVAPKPFTAELAAELETYIGQTMPRHEAPGAAVAVVQDGRVVYARGFGVREQGKPDPVTPETRMLVGSVTKTMTTMMMATLVDEGRLRWDQPVVEILPTFALADPETTQRVTVRDLVCACSGVPRRDLEWQFNAHTLTAADIITSLADFRLFTEFGETFQYSNQMVAAGGYVAAFAGGAQYADLYDGYLAQMQVRVFDAVGMPHTTFSVEQVAATADHATPHGLTLDGAYIPIPLAEEAILRPLVPAGGAWSNVNDLARYLLTELNRGITPAGRHVVSAENLTETWEPQVAVAAETSYALGWFVDAYKGLPLLHHSGNTGGFTADVAMLPDAGVGIIVLTNARRSNAFNEAVRVRLFELFYDQPMEHDARATFALEATRRATQEAAAVLRPSIDPAVVAPYLGTFANEALGEVTLSLTKGRLMLDAGEFVSELRPYADETGQLGYIMYDPPLAGITFEFTVDNDGTPVIVLVTATDAYPFMRRR